jgi:hypothetical protein
VRLLTSFEEPEPRLYVDLSVFSLTSLDLMKMTTARTGARTDHISLLSAPSALALPPFSTHQPCRLRSHSIYPTHQTERETHRLRDLGLRLRYRLQGTPAHLLLLPSMSQQTSTAVLAQALHRLGTVAAHVGLSRLLRSSLDQLETPAQRLPTMRRSVSRSGRMPTTCLRQIPTWASRDTATHPSRRRL